MKRLIILLSSLFLLSCETAPHSGQAEYDDQLEQYSAGDKQFSGLYNNFEFRTTLLNDSIIHLVNERMTKIYAWDSAKSSEELQKKMDNAKSNTRFFLSFFTPNIVDDNLTTAKTIWKIYLLSDGQRYEGKIKKANFNLSEAIAIFPYHNRWATDYYVDFPVPTASVETGKLTFVITGPLGRREATFPPQKTL